jgi:hypothetical protein
MLQVLRKMRSCTRCENRIDPGQGAYLMLFMMLSREGKRNVKPDIPGIVLENPLP